MNTPYEGDIIAELVDRKIIKVLEEGLFIFREPFSSLMRFLTIRSSLRSAIASKASKKSPIPPLFIAKH